MQKYPNATPDQIKRFLSDNGQKVPGFDSQVQGGGEINLPVLATKKPAVYTQKFKDATGTGSLEAARGSDHLTADGVTLTGEQDVFGAPFNATTMAAAEASAATWTGGDWNGHRWSGSKWAGSNWEGSKWAGSAWTGSGWFGHRWSDASWDGHRWSGSTWSGSTWSGSSWSGHRWSDGSWT